MDFLNISKAIAVFQVECGSDPSRSLMEQASVFLKETPYLIMDLRTTPLNSMFLGELVNLHNAARSRWGDRFPGLFLIGASEQARNVIVLSHLDLIMPMFPSVDAAMQAVSESGARPAHGAAASA